MEKNRRDELVAKYNEGLADPAEVKLIEQLIEAGEIQLTQLTELASLDEQMIHSEDPTPSLKMNDDFYSMLSAEKKKLNKGFSFHLPEWNILLPRIAFGAALLLVGFAIGNLIQPSAAPGNDVSVLTKQVEDLKEMMMLSLLEKESASERLRAVSLTDEMDQVSDKVTMALFKTLNSDANVNVRLAALEALTPYVRQSDVRKGLIMSIAHQDSPLVQVTLADLMVAIQEKKSVVELQKLLDNDSTPKDIKSKIKRSIDVLI
ncbi:MAG: HEAT repeat domain-containing protein [Cyclobacteriaceae bacterium]|nr:HEAT repeat domain-containing protein [Cyclobacteriaceae bacterium]